MVTIFVCWIAVVALATAFVLTLARKWGVIEWLNVHAPGLLNDMSRCSFCLSWWTGAIISLTLWAATGDAWLLAVPVCSTPLARMLW